MSSELEKRIRVLEKRLARSEKHRAELEHLKDASYAFQHRVLEEVEAARREVEAKSNELSRLYTSLRREQRRIDRLLLSIMPRQVAEELKARGRVQPRRAEVATVMVADFVDFTRTTEMLDPVELVGNLDFYYSQFDEIIGRNRVEKLKTVGDAYLGVSGVPSATPEHANDMVRAALEIRQFVSETARRADGSGTLSWDIRIGISTGPVSSGVIGQDRLSYDIWGDTVNTAARVASACAANEILISAATFGHVSRTDEFEPFGEIEAKGKGQLALFRVSV